MKILITTDWYAPVINGVVTSVLNLEKGLKKRGNEVKILTLSRSTHSYEEEDVIYIGSVNVGVVYPMARAQLHIPERWMQEILDWKPDVVHSQCEFSTFLAAEKIADKLEIPLIHTYHTVYEDYTHYFSPNEVWGRNMVAAFTRWIAGRVDAMLVPTAKVSELLARYRVTCPVDVVPTGIELGRFQQPVQPLRETLGISEEDRVLIYVGRLAKEKNLEELLEYFAGWRRVQQKKTDAVAAKEPVRVKLLLVGDGPDREALETKVSELALSEAVIFAGMAAPGEVGDYYHAGDLFVSASTSETQGLTYVEALAAGLPLLCRKDACLDGIVKEGENGWQYGTAEDFGVKLDTFLKKNESERTRMGVYAGESAERFSEDTFAERAEQIYAREIYRKQREPAASPGGCPEGAYTEAVSGWGAVSFGHPAAVLHHRVRLLLEKRHF